jgi:hypothetical protein
VQEGTAALPVERSEIRRRRIISNLSRLCKCSQNMSAKYPVGRRSLLRRTPGYAATRRQSRAKPPLWPSLFLCVLCGKFLYLLSIYFTKLHTNAAGRLLTFRSLSVSFRSVLVSLFSPKTPPPAFIHQKRASKIKKSQIGPKRYHFGTLSKPAASFSIN